MPSLHDAVVEIKATLNNGVCRDCWTEEGDGDRGEGEADWPEVVEAEGVADPMPELIRSVADKSATAADGAASTSPPGGR